MRRIARDVEIDRQDALGAVIDLGMASEDAPGDGRGTDGDDDLRRRHRLVGLDQGLLSCSR